MLNGIKRQRELLSHIGEGNMVAQGGIESTMPKPQGETSDPVAIEVTRRDKNSKWLSKLESKVLFIQRRICLIIDERESSFRMHVGWFEYVSNRSSYWFIRKTHK